MATDRLLALLKGVQQRAPYRWTARCPAHDDHSPSLSIAETESGKLLIHCFGGCSYHAVLDSLGLSVADLFPEPLTTHAKGQRPNHWHAARDVLRVLYREVLLVAIAAENIAAGVQLTADDRARLAVAAQHIRLCAEACL